jgi:hypothetical protein
MAIVVRPGRYLIEKTRRQTRGIIAHVGTGGSVPAVIQAALNSFTQSLASAYKGAHAKTMAKGERDALRASMKQMHGTWLVMSPAGVRWVQPGRTAADTIRGIKSALANSGWNLSAAELAPLISE